MAFFRAVQDSLQIDWWNKKEITLICIGTAVMVTLLYDRKADVLPIVWKKSDTVFWYVKKLTIILKIITYHIKILTINPKKIKQEKQTL